MTKATKERLKRIRDLMRDGRMRDAEGLFVIEGSKIVRDVISSGHAVDLVVLSSDFAARKENGEFLREISGRKIPVFTASDAEFEKLSSLRQHQGILATVAKPERFSRPPERGKKTISVLCDGIQDPGNLGAMIRTAAAFGARVVMLSGETADVFSPKVVRASSGTVLDVPVRTCDTEELKELIKKEGYRLLISCPPGRNSRDIREFKNATGHLVLVFGSEGKGVSSEISRMADVFFHIPLSENVESLNVNAAAAIALYMFSR
ncbi:MAG: RNA methyltransferase [Candidatus Omnitrophota bacterium]